MSIWYQPEVYNPLLKEHYERDFDVDSVHMQLKRIPKDVALSGQDTLVPHLCNRDKIYLFPYIGDADIIVLNPLDQSYYPLSSDEYIKEIEKLREDPGWRVDKSYSPLLLYFRNK